MFELKHRDAMGRIGSIELEDGKSFRTPNILPVVNPNRMEIPPSEISAMGYEGIITNSYIIYRDDELKKKALELGLHDFFDFRGFIMTDSGSYQLYGYGRVEVEPSEIIKFQEAIGSDLGVILDIPTPPDVMRERAEQELKETLRRAEESLRVREKIPLAGTIQGSTFTDLRERAAKEMGELDFELYPIGGVVPLMEDYRFADLTRIIMHSKLELPVEKPVHLFGCGHPMVFAFAVAMGCDLFDSAAYALYAKDGRYITPTGTLKLSQLVEFPCSCEACAGRTPAEVRGSGEEELLLARHNLHVTLQEIKNVRQSIHNGSLLELAQIRARSHPYLLEGLAAALSYDLMEKFNPVTKPSAFFYSGRESRLRPEVVRHLKRVNEIEGRAKQLVLLPDTGKPFFRKYRISSGEEYHICIASPVFGVIPIEVEDIYPLSQHEAPSGMGEEQFAFMRKHAAGYSSDFEKVFVHEGLKHLEIRGESFGDDGIPHFGKGDSLVKLRAMADYLFGGGAGRLFSGARVEWNRTGKMRRIYAGEKLLATIRATDGFIVPTIDGGEALLQLAPPRNRVVVSDDAVDFVREGKSVFSKFVSSCDPEIRPYQEVLVVDRNDDLLATGVAKLNAKEMRAYGRGVAVKIRHKYG
ncbi:MAG: tRNA guanosine(15) transglycosylase TgtA [Candidatus Hydrothermarchaeaceae archaeon]